MKRDLAQISFADDDPHVAYNRVWFNLLRSQRRIAPAIAKALRGAGIPDPAWYEILLALEEAGEAGLAMSRLERRLFMPQYTLSRHIARMEAEGYLRRETQPGDRRAQQLFLTPGGAGKHAAIWPVYMTAIQEALAGQITKDEAYDLARRLIPLFDDDLAPVDQNR